MVLLIDTGGRELGRAVTDADGRFLLHAAAAGTYRLRALRIGYRSWTSPTFELGSEVRAHHIAMPEIPVELAPVLVATESRCRVRPEEGTATAALWEEVKKALSVTSLTYSQKLYGFRTLTYYRILDPDLRVTAERRGVTVGLIDWPVHSLPAESLARVGYVEDGPDSTTYYGPDIGVLFSDVFLEHHCFGIRSALPDSGLTGLAFEPVGGHKLRDVAGVLWVDRRTSELRSLEFRYTNLGPGVPREQVGGRLEFERLPAGAWIVRRWWVRAPVLRVVLPDRRYFVVEFREHGGHVVAVFAADGRPVQRVSDEP